MDIDCCMATLIHVRYLPHFERPLVGRELAFQQYRVNPTWKARLQRRCRDPLVVSFLCVMACSWLDGHVATGCGSYIASYMPFIHRLDARTPRSCCVAYLWSAQHVYVRSYVATRVPHVYRHVISPPRPSPLTLMYHTVR